MSAALVDESVVEAAAERMLFATQQALVAAFDRNRLTFSHSAECCLIVSAFAEVAQLDEGAARRVLEPFIEGLIRPIGSLASTDPAYLKALEALPRSEIEETAKLFRNKPSAVAPMQARSVAETAQTFLARCSKKPNQQVAAANLGQGLPVFLTAPDGSLVVPAVDMDGSPKNAVCYSYDGGEWGSTVVSEQSIDGLGCELGEVSGALVFVADAPSAIAMHESTRLACVICFEPNNSKTCYDRIT